MTAHRAKSIKIGKINANIAKTILPKWDSGKLKATMACSIPTMGLPFMRLTFWPGPSMVWLLVRPRVEQLSQSVMQAHEGESILSYLLSVPALGKTKPPSGGSQAAFSTPATNKQTNN